MESYRTVGTCCKEIVFVVDENDENFKRAAKRVNLELLYRQREIMREDISILANRLALWND